ncbi:MAG: hypothetical protein Q8N21_03840 [bacterium]|nr:hypothetical protein [bacterium]
MLIAILMFIGGSILYGYQGMCSFLGKPLTVQNLAVGKDLVAVAQIFSYTLIAEATKKEDLRVVKGLPPMAPETIFIVAERNGKKIVITVPKEK